MFVTPVNCQIVATHHWRSQTWAKKGGAYCLAPNMSLLIAATVTHLAYWSRIWR